MKVAIERLSAKEAAIAWIRRSFLLDVDEQSRLALQFEQVARLAAEPIHYRLDYPRRYEELPVVRQAILDHVRQTAR